MVSCSPNFLTKAFLTMLLVTTVALTLSGWMVSFSYKPSFIIQSLNVLSGLSCSSNVFVMHMNVNIDLNLRNNISSLVFIYYFISLFYKTFPFYFRYSWSPWHPWCGCSLSCSGSPPATPRSSSFRWPAAPAALCQSSPPYFTMH